MTRINSYYLSEIDKIPLLTLEEEKALATKAFSGDKSAQKKLTTKRLSAKLQQVSDFLQISLLK